MYAERTIHQGIWNIEKIPISGNIRHDERNMRQQIK